MAEKNNQAPEGDRQVTTGRNDYCPKNPDPTPYVDEVQESAASRSDYPVGKAAPASGDNEPLKVKPQKPIVVSRVDAPSTYSEYTPKK